jgi:hypothetical protein
MGTPAPLGSRLCYRSVLVLPLTVELLPRAHSEPLRTPMRQVLCGTVRGWQRKRAEKSCGLRVQAAACNLAWLLRKLMEAGTPRALLDLVAGLFLVLLRLISTGRVDSQPTHPFGTAIPHRWLSSWPMRQARSCRPKTTGSDKRWLLGPYRVWHRSANYVASRRFECGR